MKICQFCEPIARLPRWNLYNYMSNYEIRNSETFVLKYAVIIDVNNINESFENFLC